MGEEQDTEMQAPLGTRILADGSEAFKEIDEKGTCGRALCDLCPAENWSSSPEASPIAVAQPL